MSAELTSYAVELLIGAGWVNITADVIFGESPLRFVYGLTGNGPLDRVADVGICTFDLDNSAGNSAGLVGYYSPLHANVRAGFTFGVPARVSFTYGGTTYYKFRGRIKEIDPAPGLFASRLTHVTVVDWMEQAAQSFVRGVPLQLSKRSDQVFSAVLADITLQPAASSIAVGVDTFLYALDNLGGDPTPAVALFQDIAQSELGFIYVKGDTTQGETLVFENRQTRMATTTNAVSFNDDMLLEDGLHVPRSLDNVFNRLETVIASRTIDAAATTVLYTVPTPQPVAITAGDTVTIWGDYRDPAGRANWVGGTAMVAPVATTDYTMNTAADGSGSDLTSSFSVTATYFASTVQLVVTNNHASSAGYLTLLRCRGKGLYRYDQETLRSDVAASQTAYGLRPLSIPMPYQDRHDIAQGAADYLANLYGSPISQADSVRFDANASATFLTAALTQEISSRIGLDETVTGITATLGAGTRGWYIQSVEFEVGLGRLGPQILCTWGLAPADTAAYWLMDQVGASEVDVSTRLGYI